MTVFYQHADNTAPTADDPPLAELPLAPFPSPSPPPNSQRCNYLEISRVNSPLKGAWIVDNSIRVPRSVLPPLRPGEIERKNLRLECRNGSINADVWVVGDKRKVEDRKQKTTIDVRDQNGIITIKIVRRWYHYTDPRFVASQYSQRRSQERVPIHLTTFNRNGRTNVYLPRTFCGPAKFIHSNSVIVLSKHLTPHVMTFSESRGTRHSFIGDYSSSDWDGEPENWEGDELSIESYNGLVHVHFADEPQAEGPANLEFWGKLFSGFGW